MKIDQKTIHKLAQLAKLNLNQEEIKNLFSDFKTMLNFINKLDEVNTDNIEPLIHIHETENLCRPDIVTQNKIKESILKKSPNHNSDYFKVPKVIKKN